MEKPARSSGTNSAGAEPSDERSGRRQAGLASPLLEEERESATPASTVSAALARVVPTARAA
jgi:hypothetical protein